MFLFRTLLKHPKMNPQRSAQDLLSCQVCETPAPSLYCDICDLHLCTSCVGTHLLDASKEHKVVPFKKWGSAIKCQKHSSKMCELYYKQCTIPVCVQCVSSKEHNGHEFVDMVEKLNNHKEIILRDLHELENSIHPKYQEMVSIIINQKSDQKENSQKLTTAIVKHGQDLHKEIDSMIEKMKSDLEEMDVNHLSFLNKQENEITHTISEIKQSIADLKKLLDSNDASHVSSYKAKNAKFRKLPPKFTVTLPNFTPKQINKEQILYQFGFLSTLYTKTEEQGYTSDFPCAEFSSL